MIKLPELSRSYWRQAYGKTIYPALADDIEVDVVIIGTGITGLTTAYLLKQAGLKVAVLEKDSVGAGTTGRTTGKVTAQHNLVYNDLQQRLGRQTARLYGEANQAALDQVQLIVNQEKIDCDWSRADNYVYTIDPKQIDKFKGEASTAASLGLPASFERLTPLPFNVQAAVKFANQAKFNSQKYLLGLARAINRNGSRVYEHSNVTGIRDGQPGLAKTKQAKVMAKNIIVATNVPTLPLLARGGYCLLEYPVESYIIAGRTNGKLRGMYISPDNQQYSVLPVGVGAERLLLIGGEGHISGLRGNTAARYQRLSDFAEKNFGVTSIEYKWSDRDYLAYDDLPLVGKLYPWSKHLYVGTAFKKWGLTNGTAAAMILRDLICGQQNPWAVTFNSNRFKPITSIPRVAAKYLT